LEGIYKVKITIEELSNIIKEEIDKALEADQRHKIKQAIAGIRTKHELLMRRLKKDLARANNKSDIENKIKDETRKYEAKIDTILRPRSKRDQRDIDFWYREAVSDFRSPDKHLLRYLKTTGEEFKMLFKKKFNELTEWRS
tara:strand:+ start:16 stop:438 length:423 start_codon:yes stop_codon:yes gene_type:complete